MDLILVLLAVTAFPVGCLAFVLWMGVIEDSIPAGVRRAVREPGPAPILASSTPTFQPSTAMTRVTSSVNFTDSASP